MCATGLFGSSAMLAPNAPPSGQLGLYAAALPYQVRPGPVSAVPLGSSAPNSATFVLPGAAGALGKSFENEWPVKNASFDASSASATACSPELPPMRVR